VTEPRVPAACSEAFVVYECEGAACIGVLARPASPAAEGRSTIGTLIVVGGPQYRVGSHRQFTLLARALAAGGYPVLRFDYRGMGDSDGEARTFEAIHDDIASAVAVLQRETGVARVVLWGLCDGASAALIYAASDPRIAGVVAVNPWARAEGTLESARLKHYYLRRLFAPDFWRKVLRGRLDVKRATTGVAESVRAAASLPTATESAAYLRQMQAGWAALRKPALFILSGQDLTAREFEAWALRSPQRRELLRGPLATVFPVADADHTFSTRAGQGAMTRATLDWIDRLCRTSC
jgi:exosortase A-associated hydrolase 1